MRGQDPETNWAGNVTFTAAHVHRPSSQEELRRLVAGSPNIRALGTGHSFNRVADCAGDLVLLDGLPQSVDIDPRRLTARVSAGMRYSEVAAALHRAGYALANLASLPHISVAGACATGTHGSGDAQGGLATSVTGLRIVGPEGDLADLSRDVHADDFDGAVVNLGALGVVTDVTLQIVPTFDVSQYVYDAVPLDQLSASFDEAFSAAYSVSAFTDWRTGDASLWLKSRADQQDRPLPGRQWLGGHLADGPRHPIPGMPATYCTVQGGVAGPWHERLPHFRPEFTPSAGEELQSEYFLPRGAAAQGFAALRSLGSNLAPVLQVSEVRTVAGDRLWLSPCYGRDTVTFHFTWIKDPAAVAPVLAAIEEALTPLGARPHWGKVSGVQPGALAAQYERAPEFRALMAAHDPAGKFRNAFVDAVFPPAPRF